MAGEDKSENKINWGQSAATAGLTALGVTAGKLIADRLSRDTAKGLRGGSFKLPKLRR